MKNNCVIGRIDNPSDKNYEIIYLTCPKIRIDLKERDDMLSL